MTDRTRGNALQQRLSAIVDALRPRTSRRTTTSSGSSRKRERPPNSLSAATSRALLRPDPPISPSRTAGTRRSRRPSTTPSAHQGHRRFADRRCAASAFPVRRQGSRRSFRADVPAATAEVERAKVPGLETVVVVGGGTAGYFAALAIGNARVPDLDVTLIESSKIPIIGVGEATTTPMPSFLHVQLGLDIVELYRRSSPTWKMGIKFE